MAALLQLAEHRVRIATAYFVLDDDLRKHFVDGEMANVGSANLNSRSTAGDEEVNLVILDGDVAQTLDRQFDEDSRPSDVSSDRETSRLLHRPRPDRNFEPGRGRIFGLPGYCTGKNPRMRRTRQAAELRPVMDGSRHATVGSRWVHRIGVITTHSGATLCIAALLVAWVVLGGVLGFPGWWATTLYSASAAITLVMVFTIQHTQARSEIATQRKLDELLRSTPTADNRLIAAEESSDDEIAAIGEEQLLERQSTIE